MAFPEDLVLQEILPKLPPKSLMRFMCVSKTWQTRISDASFIDAHLIHHTKINPHLIFHGQRNPLRLEDRMMMMLSDENSKATEIDMSYVNAKDTVLDPGAVIDIVDSCNGLVCLFQSQPTERIILWNPATRQVRALPRPLLVAGSSVLCSGFGFDTTSKDYKVVQLNSGLRSNNVPPFLSAQVFAKSGAAWRDCRVSGRTETIIKQNAVTVEGALYWTVLDFLPNSFRSRVASFDLHDDVLRVIDGPVDDDAIFLCKWRHSLAAFTYSGTEALMWAWTSSGGVRSWNRILQFTRPTEEMSRWMWKERFVARRRRGRPRRDGTVRVRLVLVEWEAPHLETNLELPDGCYFPHDEAFEYIESMVSVF